MPTGIVRNEGKIMAFCIKCGMQLADNANFCAKCGTPVQAATSSVPTICKLKLDDGTYEGEIVNGKPHGKGKLTYSDGDVYEGDWVDGERTGKGKMTYADDKVYDRYVYEGDWVNDEPNGKGKMTWADDDVYDRYVYEGDFVDGKLNGKGKMTWTDGRVYEGDFVDGKLNGKGKMTWADGRVYEGDFVDDGVYEGDLVNNKPHGKGKMTWTDGRVYEGDWVDGLENGKGKYTFTNGDVYEGDWVDGLENGKGKKTYANGDVYEGDFVNFIRHGKGKYTFANGDVYEGDWVKNKQTGKGKKTYANGDVYEGDFVDGKRTGKGKYTFTNGDVYEGDWVDDKRSGTLVQATTSSAPTIGKLTDSDGKVPYMSIEQIIKDKINELGDAKKKLGGTVHIVPDIKEETAKKAAKYIAGNIEPSAIIAIIDDTIFGSAKGGFVFTEKNMYYKSMLSSKNIPYNKIGVIEDKIVPVEKEKRNKTLTIYDKDGNNIFEHTFFLDVDNQLCELLNAIVPESQLRKIDNKLSISMTVMNEKIKKFVDIVNEMLQILGWYSFSEGVYFLDIPPGKLVNSKESLGIDENETVIILFDLSVFGSAKDALVFTDLGLRYKYAGSTWSVSWEELSQHRYGMTSDDIIFKHKSLIYNTDKIRRTTCIDDNPVLTLISIAITVFNSKNKINTYEDVIKASEDKMQYNKTTQDLYEIVPYIFAEPKKEEGIGENTDSVTETEKDSTSTGFLGGVVNSVVKGMGNYNSAIKKEKERMQNWPDARLANWAKSKAVLPAGMAALQLLKERGYTTSDIAKM